MLIKTPTRLHVRLICLPRHCFWKGCGRGKGSTTSQCISLSGPAMFLLFLVLCVWHRPIHIVSASCGRRSLLVVQHERFCSLLYTNRSFRDMRSRRDGHVPWKPWTGLRRPPVAVTGLACPAAMTESGRASGIWDRSVRSLSRLEGRLGPFGVYIVVRTQGPQKRTTPWLCGSWDGMYIALPKFRNAFSLSLPRAQAPDRGFGACL